MPTAEDLYNRIVEVDKHLAQIEVDVSTLQTSVNNLNTTITNGFSQLVALGTYTNQALYHQSQQNDTIICALEHISQQTCALLNEAVTQTGLQRCIEKSTTTLTALYEATHAQAALERQREQALRAEIEKCCPPPKPEPPCKYQACPTPPLLQAPPDVEPPPIG